MATIVLKLTGQIYFKSFLKVDISLNLLKIMNYTAD